MIKFKNGISLIALIITIIVIILLFGTVIVSLQKNNILNQADKAKFLNNILAFKEELELYKQKEYMYEPIKFKSESINANSSSLTQNIPTTGKNIYDIIPILKHCKYAKDEFIVVYGKLVYIGNNPDYIKWSKEAGIDYTNNYK